MKIGNFAAGFFDKKNSRSGVPPIEAKFPEAIEASDGNAGKIKRGRAVAADTVRTQREIIIVVDVRTGFALVNGKAGAEQARGERGHFGDSDFVAIESGAFPTCGSEQFFVDGIVDDADNDFVAVGERDGDTEAGIAMGKIRGAVERVDVPAKFRFVVFAEAFFGGDSVRRKIFGEAVDDDLFAALVGLCDEVDVAFVFDFRRTSVFLAKNFACLARGFDGDFEVSIQSVRQRRLPRKTFKC